MPSREKPDAIALLKEDHRKVEDLFEKAEKARDEDRKKMLVQQICTELMIHSMVEEEIFYPACKDKIEDEDVLDEAYVEHDGAKVLIAELLDSEPDAEFYDAKVTVLSEPATTEGRHTPLSGASKPLGRAGAANDVGAKSLSRRR